MNAPRFYSLVGMNQTERKILLELVRQEAPDLLHPGAVKRIRRGTWEAITDKFNESTSCNRSVTQLKSCIQSIMRKTLQKKAGSATAQQSFRKINFTPFEKDVILNLGKQSPIVFSKLKDAKTQGLKRKAWTAMMWAFNRTPGIKTQRTAREIKNCLVNMTNRNREVDEYFKAQMSDYDSRQRDIPEQPHLEGTVVLGGVSHPVTNVHGSSAPRSMAQQSSSVTVLSGASVTNANPQQIQISRPVSKHRFLLPKPPIAQPSSSPSQSTPGVITQNFPGSHATTHQNLRPALTQPVRTISVPQVSLPSPQLSPTISNIQTPPQPLPQLMQAGPTLNVQPPVQSIVSAQTQMSATVSNLQTPSQPLPQLMQAGLASHVHPPTQSTVSAQTVSTASALHPVTVLPSQTLHPSPVQHSAFETSGWIADTPKSHDQTAMSGKHSKSNESADEGTVEIIEIKEECSSDPEEVFVMEQQSSTSMGIQEHEFLNSGADKEEELQPTKAPTPHQQDNLESDGLRNIHIHVHRDGAGRHTIPSTTSASSGSASRRVEPKRASRSLAASKHVSDRPTEGSLEHNPCGYLIQSDPEFEHHLLNAQLESSCSTADLPSDLSNDGQDGGALRSEPSRSAGVSRRERQKRRKETVGMMKKRLLQREHDLRVEMMRKEHAWMLEEHKWRWEEHELRMNMIRINSKFS